MRQNARWKMVRAEFLCQQMDELYGDTKERYCAKAREKSMSSFIGGYEGREAWNFLRQCLGLGETIKREGPVDQSQERPLFDPLLAFNVASSCPCLKPSFDLQYCPVTQQGLYVHRPCVWVVYCILPRRA